jgi:chorismate mutase
VIEESALNRANFFRPQIDANKTVQYCLLADWYRAGKAANHAPVDLAFVRRELDGLQTALITALSETAGLGADKACHVELAGAVRQYTSAHKHGFQPLYEIILDRAVAAACTY